MPHFRNFHGVAFDFQSGCDVVLVSDEADDMMLLGEMSGETKDTAETTELRLEDGCVDDVSGDLQTTSYESYDMVA